MHCVIVQRFHYHLRSKDIPVCRKEKSIKQPCKNTGQLYSRIVGFAWKSVVGDEPILPLIDLSTVIERRLWQQPWCKRVTNHNGRQFVLVESGDNKCRALRPAHSSKGILTPGACLVHWSFPDRLCCSRMARPISYHMRHVSLGSLIPNRITIIQQSHHPASQKPWEPPLYQNESGAPR